MSDSNKQYWWAAYHYIGNYRLPDGRILDGVEASSAGTISGYSLDDALSNLRILLRNNTVVLDKVHGPHSLEELSRLYSDADAE
jgi:hypothetical protein